MAPTGSSVDGHGVTSRSAQGRATGDGRGKRLRVAVHKFGSCDGCQLAFLNAGEALLALAGRVDIVHFAEAGPYAPEARVDVAFVEGSIGTPEEVERIRQVREHARVLVAIGACATSGGVQALRNLAQASDWVARTYPDPGAVHVLAESRPVSAYVAVDLELAGCPVTTRAVMEAVASFLRGAPPAAAREKLCLECKRAGHPCVLVTRGAPCMGPVTAAGCGALCPGLGRACYGCFGPAELSEPDALAARLAALGLDPAAVRRRLLSIHAGAPAFARAAARLGNGHRGGDDG